MAARQQAHNMEMEIFQAATSEEDYDTVLEERLGKILALKPQSSDSQKLSPSVHGSLPEHAPAPPTKLIGPYTATHHAAGSFSTVYRACSPSDSSRLLALKVMTPSQSAPPHSPNREVRILDHAAHSSIISLLSSFTPTPSALALVFPFMPLSLATYLSSRPSSLNKPAIATHDTHIRSHLHTLFSALAHIHSIGIIHRDIKPSNILLASPSGPAYLADFGIAWMPDDPTPSSEPAGSKITDVGTTCYRPPELLFGDTSYGTSLDLWAAGCVVAESVGGRGRHQRELFDAGPVGGELGLVKSIFETLGTPDDERWPEARNFSAWGKMQFKQFPGMGWEEILPEATEQARDLVERLVVFESGERMKAEEVLGHGFFAG